MQVNIGCIRNKLLDLEFFSNSEKIDVICVAEHWLTECQVNLFVPKTFVAAEVKCRTHKKNGGTGIFVKNNLQFSSFDLSKYFVEQSFEICCIKLIKVNIFVISIYRSPSGNLGIFFDNFELAIKEVLKFNTKIVVAGDFNIEMINVSDCASRNFANLLRSLNLFCTNNQPTRINSCIDNIIVNFSDSMYRVNVIEHSFADHEPLLLQIFNNDSTESKDNGGCDSSINTNFSWVRKQTDNLITLFVQCLKEEKWDMINDFSNGKITVNSLFDDFLKKYVNLWHFCSPLTKIKKNNVKNSIKLKNWYTPDLIVSKNKMLAYYTVYKSFLKLNSEQTGAAHQAYLHFKKAYRNDLITAKRSAVENFISSASNPCKAAWQVISNETSPTHSSDVLLDPNGLNSYFQSSVLQLQNSIPAVHTDAQEFLQNYHKHNQFFCWRQTTPTEIVELVSRFSNSKSTDHYWLSNYIIKQTIDVISEPLSFIINRCLSVGYFSSLLKISKVIPVYKQGDKTQFQSYRPVSIVPIFSKILESVMLNQLNLFFESNSLLTSSQFGFRQGRSTTSAVKKVVETTLHAFENKELTSLVLCDLRKAFDCVPFDILLKKLSFYGVSPDSLKILESYLTNRHQYVSVKNNSSNLCVVPAGVPQGSILGPFLFLVHINDLPCNLNIESVIYADDTTLMCTNKDLNQLQANMEFSQQKAYEWFWANKLCCNTDKTQCLTLGLAHTVDFNSVKLLGIYIDSKLNWSLHISNICKKVSRVSYLLWKLKVLVSFNYLRATYFGLFQSHISYGLIIWGHSSHANSILLLQKKCLRTMAGASPMEHCRPLFISFKILTIINLYIYNILLYTKSNLKLFNIRQNVHEHFTRGRKRIDLPSHRLAVTGNSCDINCVKLFNKLSVTARDVSFNKFKSKLYGWLVENPFYKIEEFLSSDVNIKF